MIYSAHSLNDGEPTETRLERAMITLVTDYIRVQREVNMCVSLAHMPQVFFFLFFSFCSSVSVVKTVFASTSVGVTGKGATLKYEIQDNVASLCAL